MGREVITQDELMQISFGELLRRYRRRQGWSIPRLSEETGIGVAYLSRLENAKKDNPTGPLLGSIADALELGGAERFIFFCKALEAKYGAPYVFGKNRDDSSRIFKAIAKVFDYGRALIRRLRGSDVS